MEIRDKVIAITGGAQGLGLCMAETFARLGAALALIDLDQDRLDEAVTKCADAGGQARGYVANVAAETDVERAFTHIEEDFGALHGLVNNAGILRDAMLVKARNGQLTDRMSLAQWQAVIDVNLTGVFLCGREAAARMAQRGHGGVIINISSVSRAGNAGQSNYAAAKAGVAALTTTWARELARFGIRCMGIAPGFIATDMVASMKPEALERVTANIPLGRLGEQSEIAATARFIFENDYLTGRVLEVDGGIRL